MGRVGGDEAKDDAENACSRNSNDSLVCPSVLPSLSPDESRARRAAKSRTGETIKHPSTAYRCRQQPYMQCGTQHVMAREKAAPKDKQRHWNNAPREQDGKPLLHTR